ncbi:MAG TPA: hypothetical protein VMT89_02310 [Candidatus Acidoferrales bacterium]|nr:hypothetical protein [Candidatus Acidoferrales bacterium]
MTMKTLFKRGTIPATITTVYIAASALIANAQALVPPPSPPLAPEIDTGTLGGAIAMLVCGALLFMSRVQQRTAVKRS